MIRVLVNLAIDGDGHAFLDLSAEAGTEKARQEIEQIARDVLANPVIEDYRVEYLD